MCMFMGVLVIRVRLLEIVLIIVFREVKWVLVNEFRYSLSDLDLMMFGEMYGIISLVMVIIGLLCGLS